jgi:uncharacterized protein (DUF362 family)
VSGAATLLASCSGPHRPLEKPLVSIVRQSGYTQDIYDTVRRAIGGHKLNVRGKHVVLKPNLVEFEAGSAINTNPIVVHATLEAFRSMGAASVKIAEGPGHRRVTLDLAEAAGYFQTIPGFENLFTDLNLDDVTRITLRRPASRLDSLYLPQTVLGCDLLVSLPKLKTHHWAIATLSMKNLFGVVPGGVYGWPKNVLHWAGIAECITDLASVFPRTFAVVDGVVGMEGNGPIQGTARTAGVIVTGRDLVAVDATCCRLMHIDPLQVPYLKLSRDSGGLAEEAIQQAGESVLATGTRFRLLPQFSYAQI